MQGYDLRQTIDSDKPVRQFALFGLFGHEVNITDGKHVFIKAPRYKYPENLYNYTLTPMYMASRFNEKDLEDADLAGPFSFTKGCKVLKIRPRKLLEKPFLEYEEMSDRLYDLEADPNQQCPVKDDRIIKELSLNMKRLMMENDAPQEAFARLGL